MYKNLGISINVVIVLIILSGFTAIGLMNSNTYSQIIKDDIENISKLTSTNIYSEINNEITKPIFVSLTMANDSFVKSWIEDEENESIEDINEYLNGIKEKYGYDSVFLVSSQTNNYYNAEGIFKKIGSSDPHDIWYYDFINKKDLFILDVDQDQADNNALTVFVNCRILNQEGKLLGITGVGIKMNKLQKLLHYYESDFNLKAYLINENGVIVVNTNELLIEKENIFDRLDISKFKQSILDNKVELQTNKFVNRGNEIYLISRYINEFKWYIIVEKDTSVLKKSFYRQISIDFIIMLLVTLCILLLVTWIIKRDQRQLKQMAETDQLTSIPNRRAFDQMLNKAIMQAEQNLSSFSIFVFDIDDFKGMNDMYGHHVGDNIIKTISEISLEVFRTPDIIARWGGDEFAGILYQNTRDVENVMNEFLRMVRKDKELSKFNVSISIGSTGFRKDDSIMTIFNRADKALYRSKENGKNQVTYV